MGSRVSPCSTDRLGALVAVLAALELARVVQHADGRLHVEQVPREARGVAAVRIAQRGGRAGGGAERGSGAEHQALVVAEPALGIQTLGLQSPGSGGPSIGKSHS